MVAARASRVTFGLVLFLAVPVLVVDANTEHRASHLEKLASLRQYADISASYGSEIRLCDRASLHASSIMSGGADARVGDVDEVEFANELPRRPPLIEAKANPMAAICDPPEIACPTPYFIQYAIGDERGFACESDLGQLNARVDLLVRARTAALERAHWRPPSEPAPQPNLIFFVVATWAIAFFAAGAAYLARRPLVARVPLADAGLRASLAVPLAGIAIFTPITVFILACALFAGDNDRQFRIYVGDFGAWMILGAPAVLLHIVLVVRRIRRIMAGRPVRSSGFIYLATVGAALCCFGYPAPLALVAYAPLWILHANIAGIVERERGALS